MTTLPSNRHPGLVPAVSEITGTSPLMTEGKLAHPPAPVMAGPAPVMAGLVPAISKMPGTRSPRITPVENLLDRVGEPN